jgi:hypothetical protein
LSILLDLLHLLLVLVYGLAFDLLGLVQQLLVVFLQPAIAHLLGVFHALLQQHLFPRKLTLDRADTLGDLRFRLVESLLRRGVKGALISRLGGGRREGQTGDKQSVDANGRHVVISDRGQYWCTCLLSTSEHFGSRFENSGPHLFRVSAKVDGDTDPAPARRETDAE